MLTTLGGIALLVARERFGWSSGPLDHWLMFILFALSGGFCAWRAAVTRAERGAWLLMAAGLETYALGGVVYVCWVAPSASPPFPSPADWIWLAMYPFLLAATNSGPTHMNQRGP